MKIGRLVIVNAVLDKKDSKGQEQWKEIVHTILRIGIIRALNESARRLLGPPRSTDKTTLIIKVSKGAKIRNRYNQVLHLTQDTNGKVTISQLDTTNES